jgi:orotate phosphoribosyltransferase-like protein
MRSVFYSTSRWDKDDGRLALESALRDMRDLISKNVYAGDSPVRDVFESLPAEIRDLSANSRTNVMPWHVYWDQIEATVSRLGDLHKNGNFTPDLIVGISNGGLIFADILSRQAYSNAVPFMTLWAHRSRFVNYFEHPMGELLSSQLLENLRNFLRNEKRSLPYEIFLIDDIIGSTRTMRQAIAFIKKSFQNLQVRITCFVLFSKASLSQLKELEEHFPHRHPEPFLSRRFVNFLNGLRTSYEFLPYRKEIHGDLQIVEAHEVAPGSLLIAGEALSTSVSTDGRNKSSN